jgi:hypothetical protein
MCNGLSLSIVTENDVFPFSNNTANAAVTRCSCCMCSKADFAAGYCTHLSIYAGSTPLVALCSGLDTYTLMNAVILYSVGVVLTGRLAGLVWSI